MNKKTQNNLLSLSLWDHFAVFLKIFLSGAVEWCNRFLLFVYFYKFYSSGKSIPQFHTDPLSSTHRAHTRTTPFQHPKSLTSTPKTPHFNTKIPQLHTKTPQFHTCLSSTPKTLNWGLFGVELWDFGGWKGVTLRKVARWVKVTLWKIRGACTFG